MEREKQRNIIFYIKRIVKRIVAMYSVGNNLISQES